MEYTNKVEEFKTQDNKIEKGKEKMKEKTVIILNDNKGVLIEVDIDKVLGIVEKELGNIYNQTTKYHSILNGKSMDEIEKVHHRKTIKKIIKIKCSVITSRSSEKGLIEFAMNDEEQLKITYEIMKEELGEDIEKTIANILLKHLLNGFDKWLNLKEG